MDLINILNNFAVTNTNLTSGEIISSLFLTLILSYIIFKIYKITYSGVLYSKNFNLTLLIVSLVVNVIMLGISRNLILSLGLVGALSIVRFRNAIKDSKDVAFLFWAISTGIVNGVQMYKLSIISVLFIGLVLIIFSNQIKINNYKYILIIRSNNLSNKSVVDKIIKKYTKKKILHNISQDNEFTELVYEISLIKTNETKLLSDLKKIDIKEVSLFLNDGELKE